MAKRQTFTNPKNTVTDVRRLIGRKFDSPEVAEARRFLGYELVRAPDGNAHIQIGDKVYSPPEISSFVLQELKAAAEDYLGEAVEEAIITVPAYFNDQQRQATRDAGRIAGFVAVHIIDEPTAAALAHGLKSRGKSGQYVAVYDLGGATFDITILEMADGVFTVRATAGDRFLGGKDFDQRIIDWLIAGFQSETGIDLKRDCEALQRLKEVAEKTKCELSTALRAEIFLPFICADASGPKHLRTVLSRQRYNELTDELLRRTIEPCIRCLSEAGLEPRQISAVLLVGGQVQSPRVHDAVREVFGCAHRPRVLGPGDGTVRGVVAILVGIIQRVGDIMHSLFAHGPSCYMLPQPQEGVAMGAAVQAGIVQAGTRDLLLLGTAVHLPVMPHTLGIETKDGTFTPLIERNSTIPTRKSRVFTTVADNQTRVEIHVLQGESDIAARNKSVGRFALTSIQPAPRGVPQIEVTFEIDLTATVWVSALDQATGRAVDMVVDPSSGLRQAEVTRLVSERRARESKERARKAKEAVVRQLDSLVAHTVRSVQLLEGNLTPDEQGRILEAVWAAEKAKARPAATLDELWNALADVEKAAGIIGQAMLRLQP